MGDRGAQGIGGAVMAVAVAPTATGSSSLAEVLGEAEKHHHRRVRGVAVLAARWPADSVLPPLPAGRVIQSGVRCDFVDLRRTFVSLGRDELSGYVRLRAEAQQGAALLSAGGVVAAVHEAEGTVAQGTEAFARMRRAVDAGDGSIEIIELPGVVLGATRQMLVGPPLYRRLSGRFLVGGEFVDHMSEQCLTGAIVVRSAGRQGVVLLHEGIVGAYTARSPQPTDALEPVLELMEDPGCEVWVNGGRVETTLPLMIL
jgi:hypothetical protein